MKFRPPAAWLPLIAFAAAALPGAWAAHRWVGLTLRPDGAWPLVWVLVAAPLLEEAVLRPLLQQGLQQQLEARQSPGSTWPGHAANLVAALAFVALHAPSRGWAALWWLVPAWVLGEAWRRQRSLAVCAGLHSWFNLCLLLASQPWGSLTLPQRP